MQSFGDNDCEQYSEVEGKNTRIKEASFLPVCHDLISSNKFQVLFLTLFSEA